MLRSALAVIAGFLTTAVLAVGTDFLLIQLFPSQSESRSVKLLIGTLVYTEVYAAVGGYVAGFVARAMGAVYVLAGIAFVITAANLFFVPNSVPVWYKAVSLLLLVPATLIGGWFAAKQHRNLVVNERQSL